MSKKEQKQFYLSPDGQEMIPAKKTGYEPVRPEKKTKRRGRPPYHQAMGYYSQSFVWREGATYQLESENGGLLVEKTVNGATFRDQIGEAGNSLKLVSQELQSQRFCDLPKQVQRVFFAITQKK